MFESSRVKKEEENKRFSIYNYQLVIRNVSLIRRYFDLGMFRQTSYYIVNE